MIIMTPMVEILSNLTYKIHITKDYADSLWDLMIQKEASLSYAWEND